MKKDELYLNVYRDCYNGMTVEESMEKHSIKDQYEFKKSYNTWLYVNFEIDGLGDVIIEWVKNQNKKS